MQCAGQPVLPVSLKDEMGADTVKVYCPKCSQVYHPPPARSRTGSSAGVDGSAFGTTFPHLFLMTFSNLVPDPLPVDSAYIPRIFGFRVHKSARQRFNPPAAVPASRSPSVPVETIKKQSPDDDEESKLPPALEPSKNANGSTGVGGVVAPLSVMDEGKRSPRGTGTKRKGKEGPLSNAEGAAAPSAAAASAVKKDSSNEPVGGPAVPNFLIESPVKRRRRNNTSST